jgi:hypothetical protein
MFGNFTIISACLRVLGLGADDELVHHLAGVADHELHRLALPHLDALGREAHVVGHADRDAALGTLGIAGNAPVLLFLDHRALLGV